MSGQLGSRFPKNNIYGVGKENIYKVSNHFQYIALR